MPIFTGARVLSIKHQIHARSTTERLRGAAAANVISSEAAESVIAAHETILKRILSQQLQDVTEGVPLSNLVETGNLTARDKRSLKQAIRDIGLLIDIISEARI